MMNPTCCSSARQLLALGCLLMGVGCSDPQHLPSDTLQVQGLERSYHLFVPTASTAAPMPLLVAFHGGGGIGEVFPQQARFEALANSQGIILAFPQGYDFPGNEGEWQLNTRGDAQHDIAFVDAMIREISAQQPVDPTRIYATGYSLGSMFTYELACHMSDRFAAIASFAGTMPVSPDSCDPQRFAPIMHIHGEDDDLIAYGNSWGWKEWDEVGPMMDIPSLIAFWKDKYGCQAERQSESNASAHIVHERCDQNARVEHYRVSGVGHGWPDTIRGSSTHEVIWSFVSPFSL